MVFGWEMDSAPISHQAKSEQQKGAPPGGERPLPKVFPSGPAKLSRKRLRATGRQGIDTIFPASVKWSAVRKSHGRPTTSCLPPIVWPVSHPTLAAPFRMALSQSRSRCFSASNSQSLSVVRVSWHQDQISMWLIGSGVPDS